MQNNEVCSACGSTAEIACKCGISIHFFCNSHFFPHLQDLSHSHSPLTLKQVLTLSDPVMTSKIHKLDEISINLLKYKHSVSTHIPDTDSLCTSLKSILEEIFTFSLLKHKAILQEIISLEMFIEKYKHDFDHEGEILIQKYEAGKIPEVLSKYEELQALNVNDILKELESKLGLRVIEEEQKYKHEIDTVEKEIKVNNNEFMRIKSRQDEPKQEMNQLKNTTQIQELQIDDYKIEIIELEYKFKELTKQLLDKYSEIEQLRDSLKSERVNVTSQIMAERDKEIQDLKEMNESIMQRLNDITDEQDRSCHKRRHHHGGGRGAWHHKSMNNGHQERYPRNHE